MIMKLLKLFMSILVLLVISSCNDSRDSNSNETAKFSVKLVDEPGDFEHVYVEVIDVMVKYDDDVEDDNDDDSGWQSIGIINPGVYDLLELTGGVSLQLVDNAEIETGFIKQIRLVLGDDNSVVLEGETESRPLNTPSAQQSGLKIMVDQEIVGGFNYNFILDFDADESIVMAGNSGNINLKPVLRANLEINSGTLSGVVLPGDIDVEIEASNGTLTASTFTNDFGDFEIPGLPAGIYTITITPEAESLFDSVIITDVEVFVGQSTILDTVILE